MPKRITTRDPEIFQYEDGTYFYRGTPRGSKTRIERSLGKVSWSVAKEMKAILVKRLDETGIYTKTLQMKDLVPVWIKERTEEEELRSHTVYEMNHFMNRYLIPFFGHFSPSDIDEDLFDSYCKKVNKPKKMDLQNHRKILTKFLGWCRKKKYVRFVPEFEIPAWEPRERVNLTSDQIKTLFEKCDNQNLLLYISMYTFNVMRSTEITRLEWSRVDLEKRSIQLTVKDVKTKKPREIPINSFVHKLLVVRKAKSQSPWVFPNHNDSSRHMDRSGFRNPFSDLLTACKFPEHITPHDLRATGEKHTNKNTKFTDSQREAFAGAKIDVQKKKYVKLKADDLRGIEESVQIEGLSEILEMKLRPLSGGKLGEKKR